MQGNKGLVDVNAASNGIVAKANLIFCKTYDGANVTTHFLRLLAHNQSF